MGSAWDMPKFRTAYRFSRGDHGSSSKVTAAFWLRKSLLRTWFLCLMPSKKNAFSYGGE